MFIIYYPKKDSLGEIRSVSHKLLIPFAIAILVLSLGQKIAAVGLIPLALVVLKQPLEEWSAEKPVYLKWIVRLVLMGGWIACFVTAFALKKYNPSLPKAGGAWVIFAFIFAYIILPRLSIKGVRWINYFCLMWFFAALVIIFDYTSFNETLFKFSAFRHYTRTFNIAFKHTQISHNTCLSDTFVTCDAKYFLTVFWLKTPLTTSLLFFAGSAFLFRFRESFKSQILFWILPIAIFLILASFGNSIKIGIRHILPIYPFVFLVAGSTAYICGKIASKVARWSSYSLIAAAVCFFIYGSLKNFPHHISYFSEWVGGAEAGSKITADSNFIWSQDNRRLAEYVRENNIPAIKILSVTMNPAEYDYYKIPWSWLTKEELTRPAAGFYALDRIFFNDLQKSLPWLQQIKPYAEVGHTFLVFYVE